MGIKELVNAFNLNNYGVGNVNTNFTVEGKKIVGLFASGTNTKEYLREIGEEIIEEHYPSGIEVANRYYNLNCFPFVLGANPDKEDLGNGIVKVKLADSMDPAVIHNLKIHFANEFEGAVGGKVVARLQKAGVTKEEAYEWIRGTVGTGAIGEPYLYCIAFSDEYLKRKYDSETFEVLKGMYIQEFNSRLRECGLKGSGFYEYKDDMLYVKNVSDKVIKSVTEYVKKEVAFDFRTPGTEDSKVENFKDVLGDFIFKWIGKSINAYEYDIFTDKKTIEKGSNFVLIPLTKRYSGQLESLKHKDAYKVNIIHKDFVSDIRGKTARPDVASYENPVYAISNRRIAQLLPEIMQSPIAYNKENKCFEFAVDPGNFRRRDSIRGSQSSSTVTSPTRTNSAGLSPLDSPTPPEPTRTPPEQTGRRFFESRGDSDSGLGDSPPQPKDSVAHSPSGVPRSLFEQPQAQRSPMQSRGEGLENHPRQGSEREEETGRVLREEIGQASTSSQQTDDMPRRSYTSRCRQEPLMSQPSTLRELSLSEGAYESMPGPGYLSQQKPLPQSSYVITSLVRDGIPRRPILLTTNNDRKPSSREFSARSPCFEDVNILGMKSEEHDKSEQGGCSQVGVRESSPLEGAQADDESMPIEIRDQQVRYSPSGPYRSRGEMTCRSSSILFPTAWDDSIFLNLGVSEDSPKDTENICNEEHKEQKVIDKSDQKSSDECSEAKSQESESPEKKHGGGLFCKKGMPILAKLSPFKRRSVERDTMCSSKSDLVHYVTEKPLLSKRSASERRAKSNPPSKVTSPTHEGVPEWQQRLDPDQREKLRPFLSPEERKKLNSNSFSPGEERLLYLTHALEGKRELSRSLCEGEESQLLRLAEAQLSSPDNSSSKKVDRDSGFCSMGSPAVPHKGSVSSKVKECDLQQAKYMSKALGKN
ncbi:hypothetical protein [Wolbachia endosymbiont (group A) of Ennomos erosarius]|uniref:hypothetical protein n=1 Tax=Wolbachia endosymbiont (group A) of Ennomos erosarius TaxID=3066174 RepID=UPI003342663A